MIIILCNITQRELSVMQSQISTAVHGLYSRHKKIPVSRFTTPALCSLRSTGIVLKSSSVNNEEKNLNEQDRYILNDSRRYKDDINDDSYNDNYSGLKQRRERRDVSLTETVINEINKEEERYEDINGMKRRNKKSDNDNDNGNDNGKMKKKEKERSKVHLRSSDRIRGNMVVGRKLDL